MSPLKVTKEWTSSNSAFLKGQSSPTESMSSAEGGETSMVATVMIGGLILNINRFLCCLSLVFTFEDLYTAAVRELGSTADTLDCHIRMCYSKVEPERCE